MAFSFREGRPLIWAGPFVGLGKPDEWFGQARGVRRASPNDVTGPPVDSFGLARIVDRQVASAGLPAGR